MKAKAKFIVPLLLLISSCASPVSATPIVNTCSCTAVSPQEAFEESSTVVVGRIVSITKESVSRARPARLRIKVERSWKGESVAELVLPYIGARGMCSTVSFVRGRRYLIYVTRVEGELVVDVTCTRSRAVKDAAEDFQFLGKS